MKFRLWGNDSVDEVTSLREEVDRLSQDNMRLRLDEQRPMSLGKVAAGLGVLAAAADPIEGDDAGAGDEAYHLVAQAHGIRGSVLDVVQSLQVAAAQLERQLVTGVPLMEVDRRVRSGRRSEDGPHRRGRPGEPVSLHHENGPKTPELVAVEWPRKHDLPAQVNGEAAR